MSTLVITLLIAFLLVVIALLGLAISWLITGKSSIIRGACGMDPHRVRDKRCGTPLFHCELCENHKEKDKEAAKRVEEFEVKSELTEKETTEPTSEETDKNH